MDAMIIAFVSGKGGTGKSTTAVYLGGALASMGKKVLLIELDAGLRSIDIMAGVSGHSVFDICDVVGGRCPPEKAMVESPLYKGLTIIPAAYGETTYNTEALRELCHSLRNSFDFILLDTAAGIGAPFTAAVQTAHRVYLVLTADPVALRDGRMIVDMLSENAAPQRLLLNRVDRAQIFKGKVLQDLDEAIDIAGVQLLGVIPDSPQIQRFSALGEKLPKNSLELQVYTAIAKRIIGQDIPLVYC